MFKCDNYWYKGKNMNDGWRCPNCGRCYAPNVYQCFWCSNSTLTFGNIIFLSLCPGCKCYPCNGSSTGCPLPIAPSIVSLNDL